MRPLPIRTLVRTHALYMKSPSRTTWTNIAMANTKNGRGGGGSVSTMVRGKENIIHIIDLNQKNKTSRVTPDTISLHNIGI